MAAPRTELCTAWATSTDARLCDDCGDADGYTLTEMVGVASDILFGLSGRRYPGECEETVRPCSTQAGTRSIPNWHGSTTVGGYSSLWLDVGVCGCNRLMTGCRCNALSVIRLPGYPVTAVTEVKIDGAVLDPAKYRVDDWQYLVRLPDSGDTPESWPCCQRMDMPATAEDTFQVSYTWGAAPPPGGLRAAAILACEMAKACSDQACSLPENVTQEVREGVVYTYANTADLFPSGRTGLRVVDLWLASVNPHGIRQNFEIGSPDLGPGPTTAGT